MGMAMAELLTVLSTVLLAVSLIYFTKYPLVKGEPFTRTQKLMMMPTFLAVFCLIAAGPVMTSRV
jgi:hypothetical protein